MKWLFLVHQVQTRNSRERVKVWRLTKKVGAVLYRNSVYVLPQSREHLEDFQWLCQQIRDSQGEASFFIAEPHNRAEDQLLRTLFIKTREAEYRSQLDAGTALLERIRRAKRAKRLTEATMKSFTKELSTLEDAMQQTERTDFFSVPIKSKARALVSELKHELTGSTARTTTPLRKRYDRKAFRGKTWATREHIHIDRLCSAWLIKRFIDPNAKFIFAPESRLPANAILFDTFGGEFSHHGEDCTFETLLKCFQLHDKALTSMAQVVHDIDMKDGKFNRPEAAGVDAVVRSLSNHLANDYKVLEAGFIMLDALYERFSTKRRGTK